MAEMKPTHCEEYGHYCPNCDNSFQPDAVLAKQLAEARAQVAALELEKETLRAQKESLEHKTARLGIVTLCATCGGSGELPGDTKEYPAGGCCPIGHARECECLICHWRRHGYKMESRVAALEADKDARIADHNRLLERIADLEKSYLSNTALVEANATIARLESQLRVETGAREGLEVALATTERRYLKAAEELKAAKRLLTSESHRLISVHFDDEAEVFVGDYPPMKVMSQGESREEAEAATMEAVLLHFEARAAMLAAREDAILRDDEEAEA